MLLMPRLRLCVNRDWAVNKRKFALEVDIKKSSALRGTFNLARHRLVRLITMAGSSCLIFCGHKKPRLFKTLTPSSA